MKRIIIILASALIASAWGSVSASGADTTSLIQSQQQRCSIRGKVVDAADGSAVEYADVIVTDLQDRTIASAVVKDGAFTVELEGVQEVVVTVRMLGYEAWVSGRVAFAAGETKDMGTISLKRLQMGLQEVTVVADRSRIVYKLDRKTISASAAMTAAGGTAMDILSDTPSVRVDADGELTLRGSSNFLVYVDGKPSPLDGTAALQQIPAATIEDIEIITTPSAAYRSDGDVGIINIRTSKPSDSGFGGVLNLSAGTLGTWSADGKLSYRKGRNTFYAGGTAQDIKTRGDFKQEKTTVVDGYTTTSHSDGERYKSFRTLVADAGWQYDDGGRNTVLLDLQAGRTTNHRGGNMLYNESRSYLEDHLYDNAYNSADHYILDKHLMQASLDWTWKINDRNELSTMNRLRYDPRSLEYTESNMFTLADVRDEGTRGYEREHHWDSEGMLTYKFLYRPSGKWESGYHYTTYSEHGGYSFKSWDKEARDFLWDDSLDIPFYYRRQVHSLFTMINDRIGALDFDAGLRAERVIDQMDIAVEGASRHKKRLDLFPSAHLSWNSGKAGIFSVGYSRRTNRPGIWQLEPYITYEDYYTRKVGNPDIGPEFIHSVEAGWRNTFSSGADVALTGFWRHRTGVVDWIRLPYELGITLDKVSNTGDEDEYGLEFSGSAKPAPWWSSSLNGDVFRYVFVAGRDECSDADGVAFMAGWINNFTLGRTAKLQFDSHYVGPRILTQGREDGYCYFDLALRKQMMQNRISLSLVAHDVFHTAVYENVRRTAGLESATWVRPKYPNIVLGLTYRFNVSGTKEKTGAISQDAGFEGKEF